MATTDIVAFGPSDEFRVDADGVVYIGGVSLTQYMPAEITDPGDAGAIPVTRSGVCHIVTAGAETRTVADPTAVGLRLTLLFLTDGGNCVITFASPVNEADDNTLTFANVGAAADFVSARDGAGAYHWHVVGTDFDTGDAFSTV